MNNFFSNGSYNSKLNKAYSYIQRKKQLLQKKEQENGRKNKNNIEK